MAPPNPPPNILVSYVTIIFHRATTSLDPHLAPLGYLVRLICFAIKMYSLTRPCFPYLLSHRVGTPLVALAALDLGLPQGIHFLPAMETGRSRQHRAWSMGVSLLLLALHFTALWVAWRQDVLCMKRYHSTLSDW